MIRELFNKIKDFILTGISDLTREEEIALFIKYKNAIENDDLNEEQEKALEEEMKALLEKLVPSFNKITDNLKSIDTRDDIYEYIAIVISLMEKVTKSSNRREFLINKRNCRKVIKAFVRKFNNMTFNNK